MSVVEGHVDDSEDPFVSSFERSLDVLTNAINETDGLFSLLGAYDHVSNLYDSGGLSRVFDAAETDYAEFGRRELEPEVCLVPYGLGPDEWSNIYAGLNGVLKLHLGLPEGRSLLFNYLESNRPSEILPEDVVLPALQIAVITKVAPQNTVPIAPIEGLLMLHAHYAYAEEHPLSVQSTSPRPKDRVVEVQQLVNGDGELKSAAMSVSYGDGSALLGIKFREPEVPSVGLHYRPIATVFANGKLFKIPRTNQA